MTTQEALKMLNKQEQNTVNKAINIIESKALVSEILATCADTVKNFCQLQIGMSENEKFGVLFLNSQHALISFEIMFTGTIDMASVYPREVAKLALQLNAAAVILTHNHPSGTLEESRADKLITDRLVSALSLFDVRVLDHIIVSTTGASSFAQKGLL
jgi:DNA repair protein RadC